MANEKDSKPEVMTSTSTVKDATEANKETRKAQAGYNNGGNGDHGDLVEVEIIKDGDFYKKGDKDIVHPSLALILEQKGLISGKGKKYERPKFDQKDTTVDA